MGSYITAQYKWRQDQLSFATLVYHVIAMQQGYNYDENADNNYSLIKAYEMAAQYGYSQGGYVLNSVALSKESGKNVTTFPGFSAFTVSGGNFGPVKGLAIVEWSGVEATSHIVGFRSYANPVTVGNGLPFVIPDLVLPHT